MESSNLDDNCLFCKFIKSKENMIFETDKVYVFKDIHPKAQFHYLMVPKIHIRTTNDLNKDYLQLIEHMQNEGYRYLSENHPDQNYRMGFHVPVITMVKHLHMHMLVEPLTFRGKIEFSWALFNPVQNIIDYLKNL